VTLQASTGSKQGEGAQAEVPLRQAQCAPQPLAPVGDRSSDRSSDGSSDGSQEKKTILLAEDQPAILLLMGEFLRQNGFRVLPAGDGRQALELACGYNGTIDLLLSDVIMPEMDGPALALELKASRPGMKTLLMSGDPARLPSAVRASELDAGLLQKPFGLPKLLEKVQEMISPRAVTD
jgi:DNA-binding NtrC family response regulator